MKKIAAILFAGILLFNLCGFRLLTNYLQSRQDVLLEAQLDKNEYADADLVSIKTPLTMPYYTSSSKTFERVDGEIAVEGVVYKYVKRRVYNDTLELLCIPNKGKMQIASASNEFFKLCNDLQSTHQSKKSSSSNHNNNITLEYCPLTSPFHLSIMMILMETFLPRSFAYHSAIFTDSCDQPPEIV